MRARILDLFPKSTKDEELGTEELWIYLVLMGSELMKTRDWPWLEKKGSQEQVADGSQNRVLENLAFPLIEIRSGRLNLTLPEMMGNEGGEALFQSGTLEHSLSQEKSEYHILKRVLENTGDLPGVGIPWSLDGLLSK